MALVQGSCFGLQAAVSGLLVIIFGILGLKLFPTFGFLVPLGFEEGPGQALSVGKVWEGFGFAQAATLGLTFAAIGYFFAFFVHIDDRLNLSPCSESQYSSCSADFFTLFTTF